MCPNPEPVYSRSNATLAFNTAEIKAGEEAKPEPVLNVVQTPAQCCRDLLIQTPAVRLRGSACEGAEIAWKETLDLDPIFLGQSV